MIWEKLARFFHTADLQLLPGITQQIDRDATSQRRFFLEIRSGEDVL